MEIVHESQLPFVGMSHEFVGAEHSRVGISFFLVTTTEPGRSIRLHKHAYDEIVYVIAGRSSGRLAMRSGTHPQVTFSS